MELSAISKSFLVPYISMSCIVQNKVISILLGFHSYSSQSTSPLLIRRVFRRCVEVKFSVQTARHIGVVVIVPLINLVAHAIHSDCAMLITIYYSAAMTSAATFSMSSAFSCQTKVTTICQDNEVSRAKIERT